MINGQKYVRGEKSVVTGEESGVRREGSEEWWVEKEVGEGCDGVHGVWVGLRVS